MKCTKKCLWWSLINSCLIMLEYVDMGSGFSLIFELKSQINEESISYATYIVIQVAAITGLVISLVRMSLYGWRIRLYCKNDENHEKLYDIISLAINSVKVVFLALPRSVLAVVFVIPCPIEHYNWPFEAVFYFICGASFIIFWVTLLYYLFKYPCNSTNESERKNAKKRTAVMLCSPVILSIVGFAFKVAFISEFTQRCLI
ncbi:hypothetical protein ACROYT_G023026 [Oculina patagonica]